MSDLLKLFLMEWRLSDTHCLVDIQFHTNGWGYHQLKIGLYIGEVDCLTAYRADSFQRLGIRNHWSFWPRKIWHCRCDIIVFNFSTSFFFALLATINFIPVIEGILIKISIRHWLLFLLGYVRMRTCFLLCSELDSRNIILYVTSFLFAFVRLLCKRYFLFSNGMK